MVCCRPPMAAIRYFVTDVARATAFYTTQLGFAIRQQEGAAAALIRGDLTLWLSTEGNQRGGGNRIMIEILQLEKRVGEMKTAGVRVTSDVLAGPGGRKALIEDPDGNSIELLERPPGSLPARPAPAAGAAPARRPVTTTTAPPPRVTFDEGPPNAVKGAAALFIISRLVGALDMTLSRGVTIPQVSAAVNSPSAYLIGASITILLIAFILKRQNWARWVFTIITVLGALAAVPLALTIELQVDPTGSAFTIAQVALHAVGIALLFQRASNAWFRRSA